MLVLFKICFEAVVAEISKICSIRIIFNIYRLNIITNVESTAPYHIMYCGI